MTTMTLKHILVLLHVIHSFIPEECILETEYLKPTFNKQGGLEKLVEHIPLSNDEWMQAAQEQERLSKLPVCDVPMDICFDSSLCEEPSAQSQSKTRCKKFPVDVAEILVAPVCVTFSARHSNDVEKMTCFWLVILKTRKCYNFNEHLRWMINELDREDRNHVKKMANREYEDIMHMMREVVLHQYEASPDATSYLREQVDALFFFSLRHDRTVLTNLMSVEKGIWQPAGPIPEDDGDGESGYVGQSLLPICCLQEHGVPGHTIRQVHSLYPMQGTCRAAFQKMFQCDCLGLLEIPQTMDVNSQQTACEKKETSSVNPASCVVA